jgi:hypothetical protein
MTLQTTEVDSSAPTINDKKAKIAALYEKHKPILNQLGVVERNFIPKLPYPVEGENVLGFFPSEISRGVDIYIEFATPDYDQYDDERKLWLLSNNPNYDKDYQRTSTDPNKFRYLVPISELEEITVATADVKIEKKAAPKAVQAELPLDDQEDAPFTDFTIRDHIAIEKGIPVSNKPWLNELVTKQLKHD